MLIRRAITEDIPALSVLAQHSPTAAHWTEAQYRSAVGGIQPRRIILVLKQEGLVGFVAGAEILGEWELENIVVAAKEQGKGLGAELLRAFLDETRQAHAAAVFLEVRESNSPARKLYEKAGFTATGRRRRYYENPAEDAILYKKNLLDSAPEIG